MESSPRFTVINNYAVTKGLPYQSQAYLHFIPAASETALAERAVKGYNSAITQKNIRSVRLRLRPAFCEIERGNAGTRK